MSTIAATQTLATLSRRSRPRHQPTHDLWAPIDPDPDPLVGLRQLHVHVRTHGVEGIGDCHSRDSFLDFVIRLTARGARGPEVRSATRERRRQVETDEANTVNRWKLAVELSRLAYPAMLLIALASAIHIISSPILYALLALAIAVPATWTALKGCPVCRRLRDEASVRAGRNRAWRIAMIQGVPSIASGTPWGVLSTRLAAAAVRTVQCAQLAA